jgi:uncharacterized protein
MNSAISDNGTQAAYGTPGVYYETRAKSRVQPAFRTGVPIFVGFAKPIFMSGDQKGINRIERWEQFAQWYTPAPGSYLGYAVRGFFENGGENCVIVPVRSNEDSLDPQRMISALRDMFREGSSLEDIEDVDLVCVPDAMMDPIRQTRFSGVLKIQSAILAYCERMGDRFAILDGIQKYADESSVQESRQIKQVITQWRALPPEHGALYFPWVYVNKSFTATRPYGWHSETAMPCEVVTPGNSSRGFPGSLTTTLAPPCGHIAGIYARTDATVGVHKAPANEILEGVFRLGIELAVKENGMLNDIGINCLRSFPGRGVRVWGARTLSGQPDWLYINVRRLFLTLTRWIRQNMSYLVFEGNTPALWVDVTDRLNEYCRSLFDKGALRGSSPAEAFFIKCDGETNPPGSMEAGLVVTDVGLAPVVPSEFVVVRITQSASAINVTGSTVSNQGGK